MTQMNLSMKQDHRHSEQTGGCHGGSGEEESIWLGLASYYIWTVSTRSYYVPQANIFNILQ